MLLVSFASSFFYGRLAQANVTGKSVLKARDMQPLGPLGSSVYKHLQPLVLGSGRLLPQVVSGTKHMAVTPLHPPTSVMVSYHVVGRRKSGGGSGWKGGG